MDASRSIYWWELSMHFTFALFKIFYESNKVLQKRTLKLRNHSEDYLHKEWFVMKLTKMRKVNGLVQIKLKIQKLGKKSKIDGFKIKVGPSEAMSKSKKI